MGLLSWLFGSPHVVRKDLKAAVRQPVDPSSLVSRQTCADKSSPPSVSREEELKAQMAFDVRPPDEPRKAANDLVRAAKTLRAAADERQRLRREADERVRESALCDVRYARHSDVRYCVTTNHARTVLALVERQKSFGRMLARYVNDRCGGHASVCYRRAGVSRQLYSQIISDLSKKVAKRTALQLCIGLRLNRLESEQFLTFAGYSLAPSSLEDAAFGWCLEHGVYSMLDVNSLLVQVGCDPIALN